MKFKSILALMFLSFGCAVCVYSQIEINDTGVRLRELPSVDSNIIQILKKGETISFITNRDMGDSDYLWINIKTDKDSGWVYGKYVNLTNDKEKYRFYSINDVRLFVNNAYLEIRMTKESLLELFGAPVNSYFDEDSNEEWLDFNYNGRISVVITKFNNRVNQFTVYSPEQVLQNQVHVGLKMELLKNNNEFQSYSTNFYVVFLVNLFRPPVYDCFVTINTDMNGMITQIKVSGNN